MPGRIPFLGWCTALLLAEFHGFRLNAKQIMKYKRNHWTVENNLHWVLDMAFREDESRARKDNSAENFNVIRQIAFNILKSEKTFKGGITDKQFQCLLSAFWIPHILIQSL